MAKKGIGNHEDRAAALRLRRASGDAEEIHCAGFSENGLTR